MNKPTILISNDDGIDSRGIISLVTELKKVSNVFVVAPSRQQSAVGHAITMSSPIRMQKYERDGIFLVTQLMAHQQIALNLQFDLC